MKFGRTMALVLLVTSVLGCGDSDNESSGSDTGNSGPSGGVEDTPETTGDPYDASPGDVVTDGAPTAEELADDIDIAVAAVDEFWRTHWNEFFTASYNSPTVVGLYDGTASNAPTCNGTPLEANNAFYCKPEDFVAWDLSLMARGFEIGDSWVYLVVAHEWGHAIQARLDLSLVTVGSELQADCLAAAALYGSLADGTLYIEEGDTREIVSALNELGDETPWTNSADHGDPFERVRFFDQGRQGGVETCLPTR